LNLAVNPPGTAQVFLLTFRHSTPREPLIFRPLASGVPPGGMSDVYKAMMACDVPDIVQQYGSKKLDSWL